MTAPSLVVGSPVGWLELVERDGALTGIRFDARPAGADAPDRCADVDQVVDARPVAVSELLVEARDQLRAYFAGELRRFDLPLRPAGTPFQQRVWALLADVAWGTTTTYGALAAALGMPAGASRAVGAANGANPLPIVLPCHRVVGSDGTLTGYAGGLDRKAALLRLEGVPTEADQPVLF
jgi:methylated-DNA-[protein]-cysteine S-methyltransferase